MRRTNIKSLSFDTIKLEGSCFTAQVVENAAFGKNISKITDADYQIPRGLRLLDEIGRSFQIAQAQWKSYEEGKIKSERFIHEFFIDSLLYPPVLYEKLVNIDTLERSDSWYITCDCHYLRLMRKSSLARPSYLEFDLQTILKENRFPGYQMLYRIMHGSRTVGLDNEGNGKCVWDAWKEEGEKLGVRVREGLRKGVTRALSVLGSGFLNYDASGNNAFRSALEAGDLSTHDYFQELMRLMYRFLFIFTIEERKLIFNHLPETNQADKNILASHTLYEKGYSLHRLVDRSARYMSTDNYGDLWEGIKIVFRLLGGEGTPDVNPLDLPVLGGLFNADQCPHLDQCDLSNANLLEAMYRLRWTVEGNARTLIDYKNMGSEELGSVYESLLELVPQIDLPRRSFGFLGIDVEGSSIGNTRKTTGSYYTNAGLVECLIKSNLDPLIEEKLAQNESGGATKITSEQKLLSITVIDPACGSGHFLLAAARRLADRLALLRADGVQPIADDVYRNSLRDVISSCIYGVDLNPLAVELARMSLWLESHEPGKPLSFLDHHIRCGNSLVGVMDFDVLNKGIPDDAYKALSGDDNKIASDFRKRNKNETTARERKQLALFEKSVDQAEAALADLHLQIDNIQNNTLEDIEKKQTLFENLFKRSEYHKIKLACDLYVAAFYAEKKNKDSIVPTTADVDRASAGLDESNFSAGVEDEAARISAENRFFHWHLEFPEIFVGQNHGGFDCVLGNPPWERIKLQEEEFFAPRKSEIADAANKSIREQMIDDLKQGGEYDKQLYDDFIKARRNAEAASAYAHLKQDEGGRFPLTGIGDVNTYALFSETILLIKHKKGRAGFIVPTGIATDDSTKYYFAEISASSLVSLYDFENKEAIFPSVHRMFKFSLVSLGESEFADLCFFLTNTDQLADIRRHFRLARDEFILLNPNTQTCPVFRSEKDAELTKKIYRNVPVLIREKNVNATEDGNSDSSNPWGIEFMRMFDMSNDSHLFKNEPGTDRLPLYEAKMMHQFDHRWATYTDSGDTVDVTANQKQDVNFTVKPRYWIDKNEVFEKLAGDDDNKRPIPKWLMGWRDITNATNERTAIVCVIPLSGVGNNMPLIIFNKNIKPEYRLVLYSNLNSIVFDFVARHKTGGSHINYFLLKQFPVLPPNAYSQDDINFIVPRVLELTYTAVDLIPFAEDLWDCADSKMRRLFLEQRHGTQAAALEEFTQYDTAHLPEKAEVQGKLTGLASYLPPFVFDPGRRALLRAALDARYARLYGLTRDDLRYILDPADLMGEDYPSETFRVLKKNEIDEYGEYRTRRLVLEAWDGEGLLHE
ncbi:Eco57I restriction-modification methylase domain-containing protein [Treponema sp. R6D11]